jgi:MFS family permease
MGVDLNLQGNAYVSSASALRIAAYHPQTLLILVFFPFYIVFQPPMIAIARKFGPRRFITLIVVAWGLITVGHGLVKTWRQMLALRMMLGLLEAGYFSTAAFLVSTWYIRSMSRNA